MDERPPPVDYTLTWREWVILGSLLLSLLPYWVAWNARGVGCGDSSACLVHVVAFFVALFINESMLACTLVWRKHVSYVWVWFGMFGAVFPLIYILLSLTNPPSHRGSW